MEKFIVKIVAGDRLYDQAVIADGYDVWDGTYLFYNLVTNEDGTHETEHVARYPIHRTIIWSITKIVK